MDTSLLPSDFKDFLKLLNSKQVESNFIEYFSVLEITAITFGCGERWGINHGKDKQNRFFVGAFLTEILSSNKTKTIPALFAGDQNESKGIKFETNKGTLNIYIKYSMKRDEKTWDKGKGAKGKKYTCNILFSDSEYDKLVNSVAYQNLSHIVIVWTTEELKDTWLVVLGYDDAMKCLKNKTVTGSRRITVTRYGSAREFICKGVGFAEDESVMCSFDHTTAF